MSNNQKIRKTLFITVPLMSIGIIGLIITMAFFSHSTFYISDTIAFITIFTVSFYYLYSTFTKCLYGADFVESAYVLEFENLESLTTHVKNTLIDASFTACPKIKTDDKTELTVYVKIVNHAQLEIFLLITTDKLTKKGYQKLCTTLAQLLSDRYPKFNLDAPHLVSPIIVFRENTVILNNILQQKLILPHNNKNHPNKSKFKHSKYPYHFDNIHSFHSPVAISFINKMVLLPFFISNNPKKELQCTRAELLSMLRVPIETDNITLESSLN